MSTTRLPELPFLQPTLGYAVQDKATRDMIRDYARAYGLAVWKAAMEAAAQAVTIAGGGPWTNPRNPAAVIRSLPLPELAGSPQERRE